MTSERKDFIRRLLAGGVKPAPDQTIRRILEGCSGNHKWYEDYMRYNWPRVWADFEFLGKHIRKDSSILDIGAVPPLLSALFVENAYRNVTIIDPCASTFGAYLDAAGIRYQDGNLLAERDPSLDGMFDVVCLNEVVEHLSGNLLTAIGNAAACVKPGGYLFVTTPNLRSISGFMALLWYGSGLASKPRDTVREQYERASAQFGYYGHLREFTAREIIDLVESFGMKHHASAFQANYVPRSVLMAACAVFEHLTPSFRLFGKYLFRRDGAQGA